MKPTLIILVRALGYAAALAGGSVGFMGFLGRVDERTMGIVLAVCALVLGASILLRRRLERRA